MRLDERTVREAIDGRRRPNPDLAAAWKAAHAAGIGGRLCDRISWERDAPIMLLFVVGLVGQERAA